jgi:hypothetical protein
LYRRSLYTYWKRTIAPPSMVTFDSPTRESCVVRVVRTNTPLQALNLMNEVTYVEASRKLAERMLRESAGDPLRFGFRTVLARNPSEREVSRLESVLDSFRQAYRANPSAAAELLKHGESPRDESLDAEDLASYTAVASLLLNLDEAITKE